MRRTPIERIQEQLAHQRELAQAAQRRYQEAQRAADQAPEQEKGRLGRLAGMRKAQLARIAGKLQRLEAEAAGLAASRAPEAPRRRPGRRARTVESAVILAAGPGSKIWPYSETRQKAALPVGNQPLIRRTVDHLRDLGVSQVIVVVGYLQEQVRHALGDEVEYVEQAHPGAGTANALLQAAERINGNDFLVMYGDTVCARENLEALIRRFRETGVEAAALVQPMPQGEISEDWLLARVSGDRLTGFWAHGRHGSERLTGTYALHTSALEYVRRNPGIVRHVSVGDMPPLESELAESMQMMVEAGREVAAVQTVDYFVDIDKPWHILDANHAVADHLFRNTRRDQVARSAQVSSKAEIKGRLIAEEGAVIGDGTFLEGDVYVGRNSRILRGAIVGNAVLGTGVTIRDYCEVSGTIGDFCLVGHGAEFGGVMFDRVMLYHYCELSGVIGSAVDIGAATVCGTLRFDDGPGTMEIKGRKQVARHGGASYIGDYCRTGVNAILMPGSRIGPWSCVGPGAIVYQDVPSRTLLLVKQEHVTKEWGPEKYGW